MSYMPISLNECHLVKGTSRLSGTLANPDLAWVDKQEADL
jgi:hypothetical protein